MNGYMKGASAELPLKRIKSVRNIRTIISGINHHFFSCRKNIRVSLQSRHIGMSTLSSTPCFRKAIHLSNLARQRL